VKRRHHYAPQMYLEAFVDPTDAKGRLYIYDKKLGVIQPSSTKDAGLEKHYYSFHTETGERDSDTVEDALQRVEDAAAPAMRALRAGKVLDADQRAHVALFMAYQYTRVPVSRRKTETIQHSIMQLLARGQAEPSSSPCQSNDASTRSLIEALRSEGIRPIRLDELRDEVGQHAMLASIFRADDLAPVFNAMAWFLVRRKGRYKFVTSDNPVVYGAPGDRDRGVGLGTAGVEVSFTVSPEIGLLANWRAPAGQYETPGTDGITAIVNKRVIAGALRFVYASEYSEALLRLVLKFRDTAPRVVVRGTLD